MRDGGKSGVSDELEAHREAATALDHPRLRTNVIRQAAVVNPDQAWSQFGACRDQLHLFFARKAERPQTRVHREAKARRLCISCPVQLTCRDYARNNHEYGFWGGESEGERHLAGFSLTAPIGVRRSSRQPPTTA